MNVSDIDWLGATDVAPEPSTISMKNITLNIVTIQVSSPPIGKFEHSNSQYRFRYIARNVQTAASLLQQACCLVVIKPMSGCVRIACSGLMITSLLQVVNRLDAS